jgi:putative RNA 2'-phosphotransferase
MASRLTRIVALALRHKPEEFSVSVDSRGWCDLSALADGISARFPELLLNPEIIRRFVEEEPVQRFQIEDGRIRALYGHSLSHVGIGEVVPPPPLLFHATQAIFLPRIRSGGLVSKSRNGVHLTSRWDYALSVRDTHTRTGKRGVILAVETEKTRFKGVVFYRATAHIWLSPYVPPRFLSMVSLSDGESPKEPPEALVPLDNAEHGAILRSRLNELLAE